MKMKREQVKILVTHSKKDNKRLEKYKISYSKVYKYIMFLKFTTKLESIGTSLLIKEFHKQAQWYLIDFTIM